MTKYALLICLALAPAGVAADLESLLQKIATYEHGQSREPLIEFERAVREPGAQKASIEKSLVGFLDSGATLAAKDFACRQLSLIGGEASVPALARMLGQAETFEMARYALERIPSPAVDESLRKALPKATGKAKAGLIDSLGRRRDARSIAPLRTLLTSSDAAAAESAAAALGEIGGAKAAQALEGARRTASGKLKTRISEAYLKCAGGMGTGGLRIYRQLSAAGEEPMIRMAALGGLAATGGAGAIPALAAASEDAKVQPAAIRFLNRIPGPEATAALVGLYPKLPAAGQVVVLASLADRADPSARPLVTGAVNADPPEVRLAALRSLGKLGDASSVNMLAEAAASREGREQAAARESLYRLRGTDVDAGVVRGISSSTGKARIELIRAAGERGIASATETLVRSARDTDRDVRRESIRALRDTAAPADGQRLLDLLLAAPAAERREAGRTLATVLKKTERPPVAGVVAAYRSATSAPMRALLIEVLGQTGNEEALPVLRPALKDGEREVSRAAILALSDWPTGVPIPDLLEIARIDANPANQVLALRGYIKLVSAPSERAAGDSARLLGEAMQLAKQPEEKKAVLALLPQYACREAAQIAEAALNDPAVASEAKAAAERIGRALEQQKR